MSSTPTVWFYGDLSCPHSYVVDGRLAMLRAERPLRIVWRPLLLHPEIEGRAVPRTRLSSAPDPAGAERLRVEVGREAAETGIPFELPAFVPDTRPALEALELARDIDPALADRVRGALFRAYFGEATDIGDPDALLGVCVASGLDREALGRTLEDGRYRGITAEVEVEAETLGIEALPTLLFGRFKVVGRAPLPVLLDALARAAGETG